MSTCPVMRHKRREHYQLNIATGATGEPRIEEVTEPCGSPLFGKDAEAGVCGPCARGWSHPNNQPVTQGQSS